MAASPEFDLLALISSFEDPPKTNKPKSNRGREANSSGVHPTAISLYKAGLILYKIKTHASHHAALAPQVDVVIQSFQSWMSSSQNEKDDKERALLRRSLEDIHCAFASILSNLLSQTAVANTNADTTHATNVREAIHSLYAIYVLSSYSPLSLLSFVHENKSTSADTTGQQLCEQLALFYNEILSNQKENSAQDMFNTSDDVLQEMKECTLSTLSQLLINGLILPYKAKLDNDTKSRRKGGAYENNEDEEAALESIMQVIQSISATNPTCLSHLQKWQKQQQQHNATTSPTTLFDAIEYTFPNPNNPTTTNENHAQKEYLLQMLQSSHEFDSTITSTAATTNKQTVKNKDQTNTKNNISKTKHNNSNTVITRLTDTVLSILPNLGRGYIEVALACYHHNAEETISALLEGQSNPSSLHPRLQMLDTSLPIQRNSVDGITSREEKEDEEAYLIQKKMMKEMDEAQEHEAYTLSRVMMKDDAIMDNGNDNDNMDNIGTTSGFVDEYDDDYDDQYDGVGNTAADDGGMYDMDDYNAIRAYNKVAKEVEADRLFWEESRNTNRQMKVKGGGRGKKQQDGNDSEDGNEEDSNGGENDSGDGGKKYRGPDKGKGGRMIGPDGKYLPFPKKRGKKKGGGGEEVSTTTNTNNKNVKGGGGKAKGSSSTSSNNANNNSKEDPSKMSKIQKRRKNDNKAKVANHHRKERALKKTGI